MPSHAAHRVGVWIAGVTGDLATTLICGTLAIRHGHASTTGLVTALEPLCRLPLAAIDTLVFGGFDIRERTLAAAVDDLYRGSRTVSHELVSALQPDLAAIQREIQWAPDLAWLPESARGDDPALAARVDRLRRMLREFRERQRLDRVVVVNLASAEVRFADDPGHASPEAFQALIDADRFDAVAPSSACAWAAFAEGSPYVNFTPNAGASLPALLRQAERAGLPHAGNDGRTGETLVKTALAPMFASRNLEVLSWEGVNLLGNNDGRTLADPRAREAKLQSKGQVLEKMLGYAPHAGVTINYVPSVGDWKVAWDLIHFRGFLDVAMSMQFTWQGCDSILAAPLVLDLARLADFAAAAGEHGVMTHTACFFKNPLGVDELALQPLFQRLVDYAQAHLDGGWPAAG